MFDDAQELNDATVLQRQEMAPAYALNNMLIGALNPQNQRAFAEKVKEFALDQMHRIDLEEFIDKKKQISYPSLQDITDIIDTPSTAVLSFCTTEANTHVFIVKQKGVSVHTCIGQGSSTFQKWLSSQFPQANNYVVRNKWQNRQQVERFLEEVSKRLNVSQLIDEHLFGIDELIICPHQFLHLVPFSALPIGLRENRPVHLIERFSVRYISSCWVLKICQDRYEASPEYENISGQNVGIVENPTEDLIYTRLECEEVQNTFDVSEENRLQGRQATPETLLNLVKKPNLNVLHLSHHAGARIDKPMESALLLANGTVTVSQLLTRKWRMNDVKDVFLSCCETNLGKISESDDIFTLGMGFIAAGADRVVSTLWSVSDLSTAIFTVLYYEERRSGADFTNAVRTAQIRIKEMTREELVSYSQDFKDCLNISIKQQIKYFEKFIKEHPRIPINVLQLDKAARIEAFKALRQELTEETERALAILEEVDRESKALARELLASNDPHALYASRIRFIERRRGPSEITLATNKEILALMESKDKGDRMMDMLNGVEKEQYPFSSAFYWGAFTCQGLR